MVMKVKYPVPILLLIFAVVAPTLAHAESWAVYKEDKCTLTYASSLFNRGAINSEKFQQFFGPNKHTYFRVKGLSNEEKWSAKKIRAEYMKEKGAADMVYERTKRDFLVLSGYRGQNIFYTKVERCRRTMRLFVFCIFPIRAKPNVRSMQ